jgi:hypothetical protein
MLLPDWIVLYMAIAGGGALVLRQQKIGIALLMPACMRWVVLPMAWPVLQRVPLALVLLATPIVAVFGGLLLLDRFVSLTYGPRAGGHVTGTYLVRVFDAIGGGLMWILRLPFRFAVHLSRRH